MASRAIAVDLGGTNLRCAVIDEHGSLLFESRQSSGADEGPDAVIGRIARMIGSVATEAEIDDDVEVGIAAPGPLNPKTGMVYFLPNFSGWRDIPLQKRLEDETGRKVYLGNDANAAALGEYYFGSAREVEHLVYVALGTGVGGGVISEGNLIDGLGMGGELGHTTVSMSGPRCSCGSTGCIEAYCSGWAIARDAEALVRADRSAEIREAADGGEIDARAVSRAAEAGSSEARQILEEAGFALGAGLGSFVNIFNPEMVVIGGGLARIGEPLLGPARRALAMYAFPSLVEKMTVTTSSLGTRTGIFGAAALVIHQSSGQVT